MAASNHIQKLFSVSGYSLLMVFSAVTEKNSSTDSCSLPGLNCEEMSPAVKTRDVHDNHDVRVLYLRF